jgi:SAM-dependent methyltransferase
VDEKQQFFDFAAEVGLTKHLGGLEASEELVKLCRIDSSSYVLDVGCGAGATPCFLAKEVGCRVVGVDILARMVERSRERARREGVTDLVEFRVADAQDLPFEDDLYARNPAYRAFLREVRQGGVVSKDLNEYFGYGLYVGRKALE